MAKKPKAEEQVPNVNIQGKTVDIKGDVTGRDKITTTITYGVTGSELAELSKQFAAILQKVDERPEDPDVDKDEIKDTVKKIEAEVTKGDEANPAKVERWLRFLAGMAGDIFEVTAATLANPAAGIATAIRLIAKKAKEEKASAA